MSNTLQQNPTFVSSGGAVSVSKAFSSGGTNPSLYVAAVTSELTSSSFTVSDDRNAGNYAADKTASSGSGGTGLGTAGVFSKQNTSTSIATITSTPASSCPQTLKTFEFTGAATASALDSTAQSVSSAGGAVSAALTTTTNNCSIVAAACGYSGTFTSKDTGFDALSFTQTALGSTYHCGEYKTDAGAAGLNTLTFNGAVPNTQHQVAVAAYKTAAGGAPVTRSFGTILGA